jgi:small subunit ribosomal protein S1
VVGRVTNVESFGAFVELAPGLEGLVHVGELSGGKPVRHAVSWSRWAISERSPC